MLCVKYGENGFHGFRGDVVWKCWRPMDDDDGRTDDGCFAYNISSSMSLQLKWAKNNVDFFLYGQNGLLYGNEIYMTTIRYLSSINLENFICLAKICVKLCLIEHTHHSWPKARQWRFHIAFHSVTIHLMSSQITFCQVKETDDQVALTARRFIWNI